MKLDAPYYSLKETAEILKVSIPTLRNWMKRGLLFVSKAEGSNLIRVSKNELERKINEIR